MARFKVTGVSETDTDASNGNGGKTRLLRGELLKAIGTCNIPVGRTIDIHAIITRGDNPDKRCGIVGAANGIRPVRGQGNAGSTAADFYSFEGKV